MQNNNNNNNNKKTNNAKKEKTEVKKESFSNNLKIFINKNLSPILTIITGYIIVNTIIMLLFISILFVVIHQSKVEKDKLYSDFKNYNYYFKNKDLKTTQERKEIFQRNVIYIMEKNKTNLNSKEILKLTNYIFDECENLHWTNPYLPIAFMFVESKFNKKAIGLVGEKGLFQILPSTGRILSGKLNIDYYNNIEYDIMISAKMWFEYIKILNDIFEGDIKAIILAYNMGPKNVIRHGKIKISKKTGKLNLNFIDFDNIKQNIYISKNIKPYDEKILNFLNNINKGIK